MKETSTKIKKLPVFLYYYGTLLFLELIFRIFCTNKLFHVTMLHALVYDIVIALVLTILSKLGKEKVNKVFFFIWLFALGTWYSIELVFKECFGVFFSVATMGLADQAASFLGDAIKMVIQNIPKILLLFIPFILAFFLHKKFGLQKAKGKKIALTFALAVVSYLIFIVSLFFGKSAAYSPYELYFNIQDNALNIEKLGVMPATLMELRKQVFGFQEKLVIEKPNLPAPSEPETPVEYGYNITDIDFDALIAETSNKTLKTMHEYFKADTGTKQNEYTNYFGGKNLILFMGESFNMVAVSKELTPTLYRLTHEGFVFENFYSPVILSTIGGEFQELTGLYPHLDMLSNVWRKGTNRFPYGYATAFQELGYNTFAYHNNSYTFQDRDKYLKSLGFTNYKGCGNGLEKVMDCKAWPESDIEMIEGTVDDFLGSEKPFMTYYATVSGHMPYVMYGTMANKYKEEIKDLPYSDSVKAYIASQIELDRALELLIQKLTDAGKLEDTVIALVGDHYPYALTADEMNEASTYKRDERVEINRSNFILWNSEMPTTKIKKVGSQIDVLPTILNAFGVKYDSRLIIGNDILSTEPGLAIFDNRSWVSDYGTYFAANGKFVPREGVETPTDYVTNMNKVVSNRITMSKNIIQQNYYDKVIK